MTPEQAPNAASALLVIGIHREELDFGREVIRGLSADEVDVLEIPEGLSGRRPLPDQWFRYGALHQALYGQLLAYLKPSHRLLIDLHAGYDERGPSADFLCADAALRGWLEAGLADWVGTPVESTRVIPLGMIEGVHALTVIPRSIWDNAAFNYLGLELYLPSDTSGCARGVALARTLVRIAIRSVSKTASAGGESTR